MLIPAPAATPHDGDAALFRRLTLTAVLALWITQYVLLTLQTAIEEASVMGVGNGLLRAMAPRAIVMLFGICASFTIAAVLHRLRNRAVRWQVVIAIAGSALGSLLHALVNLAVFDAFMGSVAASRATLASYAAATTLWFWTYAAASAVLLSLNHLAAVRERDRRLAEVRHVAHEAQLAALRYQLHPHFVFNTLNAIASLIGARDVERAEHMVEDLAEFLRATLTLHSDEIIPLRRELELQALYMGIEMQRFPDRLHVVYDVAPTLLDQPVPSLLLQPLVENVVKHAVRRSTMPITVTIAADMKEGALTLSVRNNRGDAPAAERGAAIGLANVARRVALCDPPGRFDVRDTSGSFMVEIVLPPAAACP